MTRLKISLLVLLLVAVVFTIAFTFLTIEVPRILGYMLKPLLIPDYHPVSEWELIEGLLTYLRPIGYACVIIVLVLTVLGFGTERSKLSSIGSLTFFLPTFGYYVVGMFFLTSVGILRLLWLPLWDLVPGFQVLKLGHIVYLPYAVVVYPFFLAGFDIRFLFAETLVGFGLLIFFVGAFTWFVGKYRGNHIIDFWIYKYSRHPQYLGYIIWSYGVMLIASLSIFPRAGYYPGPSLPWLLSTLIVVSIALKEEILMTKDKNKEYLKYRQSTPFMLSLPKTISMILAVPMKISLRKDLPETGKEVAYTFLVYTAILLFLSIPFFIFNWPPGFGWYSWP